MTAPRRARMSLARPSFWRAASTALLAVFAVAFVAGGFSVPDWAWIPLILSGITFAIELTLLAASRRA